MDQYESTRKIKQLGRYGPGVVGMCKGQWTTGLWIPESLPVAFAGRSAELRGISPENRPSGRNPYPHDQRAACNTAMASMATRQSPRL